MLAYLLSTEIVYIHHDKKIFMKFERSSRKSSQYFCLCVPGSCCVLTVLGLKISHMINMLLLLHHLELSHWGQGVYMNYEIRNIHVVLASPLGWLPNVACEASPLPRPLNPSQT